MILSISLKYLFLYQIYKSKILGMKILPPEFFKRDVLDVAPDLLGKYIVRKYEDGRIERFQITEVEAYRGEEDKACHASKGRTKRTEVMYHEGGKIYVYLIYGMYWLLNFVTGNEHEPQAVLIRGVEGVSGPGKLGRKLQLSADFYGESLPSEKMWLETDDEKQPSYTVAPRIGVGYAEEWAEKLWRFAAIND